MDRPGATGREASIPAPLKPLSDEQRIRPMPGECGCGNAIPNVVSRTGLALKRQQHEAWMDAYVPDIKGVIEGDEAI